MSSKNIAFISHILMFHSSLFRMQFDNIDPEKRILKCNCTFMCVLLYFYCTIVRMILMIVAKES